MKTRTLPRLRRVSAPLEDIRTGLSPAAIARAFCDNLHCQQARFREVATRNDNYMALAYTVRDRLLQRWINTAQTYLERQSRTVVYLSAEYLMGPQLGQNLINLGIVEPTRQALASLGLNLEDLLEQEEEPGLGNGGLGRLAACFLDSLATLQIPSIGYGIRYEFGIFDQALRDGWQVEITDKWLRLGNPWEIARPEISFEVPFGGHTEPYADQGRYRVRWVPHQVVRGVAYDTPVVGYRVENVNLLRLWKAEAVESFDFRAFDTGDYYGAVMEKVVSENITKVLYPNDQSFQGKQLRLQQQFFFASCALQDMIRLYGQRLKDLSRFHEKFAVQLNDTHPAIAVAELMRLLVDVHGMDWEPAWEVARRTFGYTNHTLLPEALERWPLPLFGQLLPRHLEIVYEINRRFLQQVRARFPDDPERVARLSLIDESGPRYVRMAHLATVGSHTVNGVSRLHSGLLREGVLRDFHEWDPARFANVTNGVSPRRFLLLSNPALAGLISDAIGTDWARDLDQLRRLEPFADDPAFRERWRQVKRRNKAALSDCLRLWTGAAVSPDSMFDVLAKRVHEYKRQHLAVLHLVTLYNRWHRESGPAAPPRTAIFAGKAAPGYYLAKLIVKLVNSIATAIDREPALAGRLKVVFAPDFNVKNAQRIYPAADLSEQISTAGKEASGTGNMKFALNGALTIGTLDGANIEIREAVGPENFFLFGLTADQVREERARGYRPGRYYEENPDLREAIDQLRSGLFSPGQPDVFRPLVDSLLGNDDFMVLADYAGYVKAQDAAASLYLDAEAWSRKSILNVARLGAFSSDRAIREYCESIWKVRPVILGATPPC